MNEWTDGKTSGGWERPVPPLSSNSIYGNATVVEAGQEGSSILPMRSSRSLEEHGKLNPFNKLEKQMPTRGLRICRLRTKRE